MPANASRCDGRRTGRWCEPIVYADGFFARYCTRGSRFNTLPAADNGSSSVRSSTLRGHRIIAQIPSTWFPLYDRNLQTFVPNIMLAKPEDFAKATQRIWHAPGPASAIDLPVISMGK
jgi:hypothetical protein